MTSKNPSINTDLETNRPDDLEKPDVSEQTFAIYLTDQHPAVVFE